MRFIDGILQDCKASPSNVGSEESGSFTWEDPLAMYHIDVNTWAFVDGHVETHQWQDKAKA
jgi:prepilin-type processing-associated H-X9-DG protein